MATKTGQQIEDDIYHFIRLSPLSQIVSGSIYKYGLRPKDSTLEDIVVKFVSGEERDIQSGEVIVHFYIPDVDTYGDGTVVKDISRCREIETAAMEWISSMTTDKSNYYLTLAQTICTEPNQDIKQHYIVVRINYKLTTF